MKRVLLICGAGASSGFMAQSIRKAARKEGYELKCEARSEAQLKEYLPEIDILLVGPHLAYMKKDIIKEAAEYEVDVEVIPQGIYGMLDGKKALELIKAI